MKRKPIIIIGSIVLGIASIGAVAAAATGSVTLTGSSDVTRLSLAASTCQLSPADEGHSVTIDTEGEEDASGDSIISVVCMVQELDIPDSLVQRMDHTRALDGVQTGEWDAYTATWSYHPDSGMLLIIEG